MSEEWSTDMRETLWQNLEEARRCALRVVADGYRALAAHPPWVSVYEGSGATFRCPLPTGGEGHHE